MSNFETGAQENAFQIIAAFFDRAGLSGLDQNVRDLISRGIENLDAIFFNIRETPQFKARFKGNEARRKAGLPELDPATYIGMEQAYSSMMRANGLPAGFYDQPSDFEKWIEGDVAPEELQQRINQGYTRARDADPEVRRQLQELYGVSQDGLAAYFLDPERARPLMARDYQRQVQAAEVSAIGSSVGKMQLGTAEAEGLVAKGISPADAQSAFAQRTALEGLYKPMAGEEQLNREQELGAMFGYDTTAQQVLQRRRRGRLAEFESGGGFARTGGATSGTIESSLGASQ